MSHMHIRGQQPTEFPVTIAEVIDRLVLTDVNEDYWTLNVGRYNESDDVKISPALAEELLKLQARQREISTIGELLTGNPTTEERGTAMSDQRFSHLDDPAEREWLTSVPPMDVLKNAHRIYDFMAEAGLSSESVVREEAFRKASHALIIDYDVFYEAWLNEMPVGPAAIRRAKNVTA